MSMGMSMQTIIDIITISMSTGIIMSTWTIMGDITMAIILGIIITTEPMLMFILMDMLILTPIITTTIGLRMRPHHQRIAIAMTVKGMMVITNIIDKVAIKKIKFTYL